MQPNSKVKFDKILRVLERVENIPSLECLTTNLSKKKKNIGIKGAAIGFDANVLLRLSSHPNSSDIVDYLAASHKAPIIFPGQVIQEFWNNQLNAVETISDSLKRNFDKLRDDAQKIDEEFGTYAQEFDALIDKFSHEYGFVYDQKTLNRISSILDNLKTKALVPYVPRELFYSCALVRKQTKTPPGFKDDSDNYGDSFVWFDFLAGLLISQKNRNKFNKAVFVTNEKKIDWNRAGVPHPILAAEVKEIFKVEFEIWSLQELADNVSEAVT